jgi:hypothetical protein
MSVDGNLVEDAVKIAVKAHILLFWGNSRAPGWKWPDFDASFPG